VGIERREAPQSSSTSPPPGHSIRKQFPCPVLMKCNVRFVAERLVATAGCGSGGDG
jgi:hypothetical protein